MNTSGVTRRSGRAIDLQQWSRGWRRLLLGTGMLVYPGITAGTIHLYSAGAAAVSGYVIVAAFSVCYLAVAVAVARLALRLYWIALGAMTILFVAELPFARVYAFYLCAVILSAATIRLRRRVAPFAAVAVLASIIVPIAVPSWHSAPGWTQAVMIVFTVLLVYAFAEIVRANQTLLETRAEVARLASEAERNRIARDLHDLVGHSLTAITVKSNLARQLAASEKSPALQEITEIEQLSRQALADVRAAVTGYREVTIAGELARGRELLRASGVIADLPTATEAIDATHQELFGWAVREGVTNIVRHARATRCTVTISPTDVEIRDDGVGSPAAWGNGLAGLRERVEAVGGSVEAGPADARGWRLRVSLDATKRR